MRYLRYQCLTAALLCLVMLIYVGGIARLRPVYDALRRFCIKGSR